MKLKKFYISILIALVVTLIIGQTYVLIKPQKKITDVVIEDVSEDYYSSYGVIIRDEKVIKSKSGNKIFPIISQGNRVAANSSVASVYSQESSALLNTLNKAEKELVAKLTKNAPESLLKSFTILKTNKNICEEIDKIIDAVNSENMQEAIMIENTIKEMTSSKIDYILENDTLSSDYKELKKRVQSLRREFRQNSGTINSKYAGTVSYLVDGYEGMLKPTKLDKLNLKSVDKIYNDSSINQIKMTNKFKIICGFQAYLALIVDKNFASQIDLYTNRQLKISDLDLIVKGKLIAKENTGKKSLLFFEIDKKLDELSSLRKIKVDIAKSDTMIEGLKVNESALFDYNPDKTEASIYIVRSNIVYKKSVAILAKDSTGVIIKDAKEDINKIDIYDEYVIKLDSVKEGDILD